MWIWEFVQIGERLGFNMIQYDLSNQNGELTIWIMDLGLSEHGGYLKVFFCCSNGTKTYESWDLGIAYSNIWSWGILLEYIGIFNFQVLFVNNEIKLRTIRVGELMFFLGYLCVIYFGTSCGMIRIFKLQDFVGLFFVSLFFGYFWDGIFGNWWTIGVTYGYSKRTGPCATYCPMIHRL